MEWNTLDGYIIKEHLGQVAMSLWDTLYRWLCHHETLYIGGYVIMKHPMQIGISLRNAPCRCLCHCGIPCIGGYVIMEHPMYMLFHCGGMIFKVPYTSLKAPGDYIYSIVGRPVFLCVVKDGISISMLFKNHTITKLKELRSLVFSVLSILLLRQFLD